VRPFMAMRNQGSRVPVATLAVAGVVAALSTVSVPTAGAVAAAVPAVASVSAHPGVPAGGFRPVASASVPHSSMVFVLGMRALPDGAVRYEVVRIYRGKASYSVVKDPHNAGFTSIAAGSSSAVWIGGAAGVDGPRIIPVIMRKRGNSWTEVKLPPFFSDAGVESMSASSPTNVWAVGFLASPDDSVADALQWNGKAWKAVDTGGASDPTWLSVSTSSPSNVWAVENYNLNEFMHWNGRTWSVIDVPSAGHFSSIATDSRKRVWAVGPGTLQDAQTPYVASAVRLDGSRWVTVRAPKQLARAGLTQVTMRGSSVWAVGWRDLRSPRELILHSHGKHWAVVKPRHPEATELTGVSAESKTTALAIGSYTTGTKCPRKRDHGLILLVHGRSTHRIDPTAGISASCGPGQSAVQH
jgi:hypothetical protein